MEQNEALTMQESVHLHTGSCRQKAGRICVQIAGDIIYTCKVMDGFMGRMRGQVVHLPGEPVTLLLDDTSTFLCGRIYHLHRCHIFAYTESVEQVKLNQSIVNIPCNQIKPKLIENYSSSWKKYFETILTRFSFLNQVF